MEPKIALAQEKKLYSFVWQIEDTEKTIKYLTLCSYSKTNAF